MTEQERTEDKTAPSPAVPVQGQAAHSDEPLLRRPEEDITHRPRLRVRPIGSRVATEPPKPAVRAGTLSGPQVMPEEAKAPEVRQPEAQAAALPPKKEPVPQEGGTARYPYATYRTAPPDEKAEKAELAMVTGTKLQREVPTGLVLGVALIVIALLAGVFIVRLSKQVASLQRRVSRLEALRTRAASPAPQLRTAAAKPQTTTARRVH